MRSIKATAAAFAAGTFYFAGGAALSVTSGCGGEPEAKILSTDKSKDELQKEIENPFGEVAPKGKGKAKAKGGARSRE